MNNNNKLNNKVRRVFLIVLDSLGIGEALDAHLFNDFGSNTLSSISKSSSFNTPNLANLGLFNIDKVSCGSPIKSPTASFGRICEASNGKDTTIGHWEIAGVISRSPLPTFPNGFPRNILDEFYKKTNKRLICNLPYSGTQVIKDFGEEHLKTGDIILYTSADSVFQLASHEDVVPLEDLYSYCEIARDILVGEFAVGRVIARPFTGEYPFQRTSNRHDYSLLPPTPNLLTTLGDSNLDVISVGKISDIFAGVGINKSMPTKNNKDGMQKALDLLKYDDFNGLAFINLVDFDMLFGHRNDIDGYADALTRFDADLLEFINNMRQDDILFITADHGCDPAFPTTDHTREDVPLLVYGNCVKQDNSLGTLSSFADISQTILDLFNISSTNLDGTSFSNKII
ncbi:MAG: phosphopentomutase [bacterium]